MMKMRVGVMQVVRTRQVRKRLMLLLLLLLLLLL